MEQFRQTLARLVNKHNGCTYFGRHARIRLFKDFAPYSFTFQLESLRVIKDEVSVDEENEKGRYMETTKVEQWKPEVFGGVILHGAHDGGGNGGAPTFSVNMSPEDGWAVHY